MSVRPFDKRPEKNEITLTKTKKNIFNYIMMVITGDVLELSYFVTSGSSIVANGKETVNVGEEDLTSEFVGAAEIIKFGGNVSTSDGTEKRVLSKKIINIDRPLADEARVSSKIKLLVKKKFVILSICLSLCTSFSLSLLLSFCRRKLLTSTDLWLMKRECRAKLSFW
jgi:hypothetical protein